MDQRAATGAADRAISEAERLAEADASVEAGFYATSAEVKAWIDSLGGEAELPPPYPVRPRPL